MSARKKQRSEAAPVRRDIVTLADLAPRHDIRGGRHRRVFGADAPTPVTQRTGKQMKGKTRVE